MLEELGGIQEGYILCPCGLVGVLGLGQRIFGGQRGQFLGDVNDYLRSNDQ